MTRAGGAAEPRAERTAARRGKGGRSHLEAPDVAGVDAVALEQLLQRGERERDGVLAVSAKRQPLLP